MGKNIYYRYNPETDNFERYYPSWSERLLSWGKFLLVASVLAVVLFLIVFYCFDSPTLENLRKENKNLKTQYGILSRRLDNSLKVMDNLSDRDNNFYRVLMQLDPIDQSARLSGLENEMRFKELKRLPDDRLVDRLQRRMDLLEHMLYSQIESLEEIRKASDEQSDRIRHVPSVIPISMADYTMSSGYGYRVDPIYGMSKFHEGIDFAASGGTNVFATADGIIDVARRVTGYGNCIDINHGYNYTSRYAHLSEIFVKEGEAVRRGQLIGTVGSTGKSTGPHLHYEVRFKDEPQNPVNYYFMDLSPEEYALMIQEAENAAHVMD